MKTLILTMFLATACSNENNGGSDGGVPVDNSKGTVEADKGTPEDPGTDKKTVAKTDAVVADTTTDASTVTDTTTETQAFKLTAADCIDPDLTKLQKGVQLMLCDGTVAEGSYEIPAPPVMPDLTALTAANVKAGVVIAGVTGSYDNRPADCAAHGQVGCVSTNTFKSTDLSALTANVLKSGVTVAGVAGTYDNRPADCSAHGQTGCVATNSFKSTDLTALTPAVLKKSVTVAGVTGDYPSVANPLPGSSGAALTASTFNARVADSGTVFEWYDAEGNRYTGSGDANLAVANVKKDVQIFGVIGTLDATMPGVFDVRYGVTVGSQTGKLNYGCGGTDCSTVWEDVTLGGCATHSLACRYKNRNNGVTYGRAGGGFKSLINASAYCSSLTLDGQTGWRLPSRFELQVAAADNIWSILSPLGFTFPTSGAAWEINGSYVDLNLGFTTFESGTTTHEIMCVK